MSISNKILQVKLLLPHGAQTELIIFHTDSVWQGKAETLRPGTQVSFNARRLPAGMTSDIHLQFLLLSFLSFMHGVPIHGRDHLYSKSGNLDID